MFADAPQVETQYDLDESATTATLFGGGADISGRLVEYWGDVWTIKGKNYLGDGCVERQEVRPAGCVTLTSSIAAIVLPKIHPHFARLVPTN